MTTLEQFIDGLNSSNPDIRKKSLLSLAKTNNPQFVQYIQPLINDENNEIKLLAQKILILYSQKSNLKEVIDDNQLSNNIQNNVVTVQNLDPNNQIYQSVNTNDSSSPENKTLTKNDVYSIIIIFVSIILFIIIQNLPRNSSNQEINNAKYNVTHSNKGINVELTDDDTLHLAAKEGKVEIIKTLLDKKVNVNALEKNYYCSALHYAAENNQINVINLLLSYNANINTNSKVYGTPLHLACKKGHDDATKLLIEKGADVNLIDGNGETALFKYLGPTYIILRINMIKLLIDSGASLNVKDFKGNTPLHNAASNYDDNELINLLISKGANPNAQNNDGETPLHCAIKNSKIESSKTLLENKVTINIKNNRKQTPLDLALKSRNEDLVSLLKEYSAN